MLKRLCGQQQTNRNPSTLAACAAPRLLPHVEKIVRAAADPELREVATNALSLLERVSREGQEAAAEQQAANKVDWQVRRVA